MKIQIVLIAIAISCLSAYQVQNQGFLQANKDLLCQKECHNQKCQTECLRCGEDGVCSNKTQTWCEASCMGCMNCLAKPCTSKCVVGQDKFECRRCMDTHNNDTRCEDSNPACQGCKRCAMKNLLRSVSPKNQQALKKQLSEGPRQLIKRRRHHLIKTERRGRHLIKTETERRRHIFRHLLIKTENERRRHHLIKTETERRRHHLIKRTKDKGKVPGCENECLGGKCLKRCAKCVGGKCDKKTNQWCQEKCTNCVKCIARPFPKRCRPNGFDCMSCQDPKFHDQRCDGLCMPCTEAVQGVVHEALGLGPAPAPALDIRGPWMPEPMGGNGTNGTGPQNWGPMGPPMPPMGGNGTNGTGPHNWGPMGPPMPPMGGNGTNGTGPNNWGPMGPPMPPMGGNGTNGTGPVATNWGPMGPPTTVQ